MDGILGIDTVLHHVRQVKRRFGLPSDAVISEQTLLLGGFFYGYRFTSPGFVAIWSAASQTIELYDSEKRLLDVFSLPEVAEETSAEIIPFPDAQLKAA